jgi:hypothetical protein
VAESEFANSIRLTKGAQQPHPLKHKLIRFSLRFMKEIFVMEMTENKALTTIQPASLAQVGKSDGAMDKLAQLARELLRHTLALKVVSIYGRISRERKNWRHPQKIVL